MNPAGFWQITAGQVVTVIGLLSSAALFVWRTADLHGEQRQQLRGLSLDVEQVKANVQDHTNAIAELSRLASASEKRADASERRLELLEQEMRDNRARPPHIPLI